MYNLAGDDGVNKTPVPTCCLKPEILQFSMISAAPSMKFIPTFARVYPSKAILRSVTTIPPPAMFMPLPVSFPIPPNDPPQSSVTDLLMVKVESCNRYSKLSTQLITPPESVTVSAAAKSAQGSDRVHVLPLPVLDTQVRGEAVAELTAKPAVKSAATAAPIFAVRIIMILLFQKN
jgi:hypothetical protein